MRIVRWGGLVACLVLLAMYGLSVRWRFGWNGASYGLGVGAGKLRLSHLDFTGFSWKTGWFFDDLPPTAIADGSRFGLQLPAALFEAGTRYGSVLIPLWMPILVAAALTALAAYRVRRLCVPGYCSRCDYPLTGVAAERCGGCGRRVRGARGQDSCSRRFGISGTETRVAKRPMFVASLAMLTLVAGLWVTSYLTHWVGTRPPVSCGLRHGKIKFMYFASTSAAASRPYRIDFAGAWFEHQFTSSGMRIVHLLTPLWIPMAAVGAYPAAMLVLRGPLLRRYRRRHGLCIRCGYDLRGNVTGRCPECGWTFGAALPDGLGDCRH